MSLYGALFSGVSGLKTQSNRLGIVSDNISNVNTVGYKQTSALFESLVTPGASSTQYAPGGVIGGNRALVDRQGLLQGTDTSTDVAISGRGFFVVSGDSDGTSTFFTRAGSFREDSLGNFVNAGGFFLKAWPLDRDGDLPGPDHEDIGISFTDINSLRVVNTRSISGKAAATTTVQLGLNLDARQTVFPGSAQLISMDSKSTNNRSLGSDDIIVGNEYGAANINQIRRGDTFTITTTDADDIEAQHIYEYGGFTASRSVLAVTPVTLGATAFDPDGTTSTVVVTATDHGLGPAGTTRYVRIDGVGAAAAFSGGIRDVEGLRLITIIDDDSFSFVADTVSTSGTTFGSSGATIDPSPGDGGSLTFIEIVNNGFTVPNNSSVVTVTTSAAHGLGPVGSTRRITIEGLSAAAMFPNDVDDVEGVREITILSTTTFSFNADNNSTALSAGFGGNSATVNDFAGNILDASSVTTPFLNVSGITPFTDDALNFIVTLDGTDYTFTYRAASPTASSQQFNNLNNLASAIDLVDGLTARVVSGRLYVSAEDASKAVSFSNGDNVGDITSAKGGIDWVKELDLQNITLFTPTATREGRFNTLGGLATIVNATDDLKATIANPNAPSLTINVKDPRGTIQFEDEDGIVNNYGSLLGEFGLDDANGDTLSLNGVLYAGPGDTGEQGPEYDATDVTKNMASGSVLPQFSRNIRVFDTLGLAHDVTVGFLKIDVNLWAVEAYVAGNDTSNEITETGSFVNGQIATGLISFNGDGTLSTIDTTLSQDVSITWNGGSEASTIAIDWGTSGIVGVGRTDGLSQFGADYSLNFIEQNGAPVGELTSVAVDENGFITATFTNGEVQRLFKIPVADFNSPNGLSGVSGNVYAQSNASGAFNLREAGKNGVGKISPSSLESSNVELSEQLTDMIVAQRAYQANTRIITTTDRLLEELNGIIR